MIQMASEKVKNTLKELGLTEYETRAYLGLVKSGASTAGDLSDASGVPQSRIYDILSNLEKKGWIESQSGRPARYRAKPPSEVMRLVKIKQEKNLREATETVLQELEPIFEEEGGVERPDIWTIRGYQGILGRIEAMFTRAEMEILVTIPNLSEKFSSLKNYVPLIETKNLELKILTSEESELAKELASIPRVKTRIRKPIFGGGVIVDGKEVLLVLESSGETLGIWSEEVGLSKFAKEYFEYLWSGTRVFTDSSSKSEES